MRKSVWILLLLFIAVFALLASCGGTPEETVGTTEVTSEPDLPGVIELFGTDAEDYVIVRGDTASEWEKNGAVAVLKGIKEMTGSMPVIRTDYDGRGGWERVPREILVGATNRSTDCEYPERDQYGYGGYSITVSGEKIIIDASGEPGMLAAVEKFLSLINLSEGADGSKILTIGKETSVMVSNKIPREKLYDIADKRDLVAICYSTWFEPIIEQSNNNPANIAEVLEGKRDWGAEGEFHYWGKPALGYYRSTDRSVIRTHMTQLAEAGIDFIIIDNTNAVPAWKNVKYKDETTGQTRIYWDAMVKEPGIALMETLREMRDEGLEVPRVAMWCGCPVDYGTVDTIYSELFSDGRFDDLWVWWDGKPLFLVTQLHGEREDLTIRMMWGLKAQGVSEWSFLNYPNRVAYDKNGEAEQVCVCVAVQQGYMSQSGIGRRGGLTFWEQWKTAFAARPKVVSITWWNEWAAQRFIVNGESAFVDNYSQEYSRDIEPMEGGHGDTYYKWMKEYIAAYKSGLDCPKLVDETVG